MSQLLNGLAWLGLDFRRIGLNVRRLPRFTRDLRRYQALAPSDSEFPLGRLFPALLDRDQSAGELSSQYFIQDLLVAQLIFDDAPANHFDVGSRIDGFVAHVAAFREITVLDIRPLVVTVPNIKFVQIDLMGDLGDLRGSVNSVSCLHALEHFGLGRYGDRIDPSGWLRGLENLRALLTPGGRLYLSVPTGSPQRVEFNAHRIFAFPYLRDALFASFTLERLFILSDQGELAFDVDPFGTEANLSFGLRSGLSIWVLRLR